jgi:hypothetical protein
VVRRTPGTAGCGTPEDEGAPVARLTWCERHRSRGAGGRNGIEGGLSAEQVQPLVDRTAARRIDVAQVMRREPIEPGGHAVELGLLQQVGGIRLVDRVLEQQRQHVGDLRDVVDALTVGQLRQHRNVVPTLREPHRQRRCLELLEQLTRHRVHLRGRHAEVVERIPDQRAGRLLGRRTAIQQVIDGCHVVPRFAREVRAEPLGATRRHRCACTISRDGPIQRRWEPALSPSSVLRDDRRVSDPTQAWNDIGDRHFR